MMKLPMKLPVPGKGQNMVEYGLMLAIIVGIGGFIYSHSGYGSHLTQVFHHAGNLMEKTQMTAEKAASYDHDRSTNNGLAELLKRSIGEGRPITLNDGGWIGLYVQKADTNRGHLNGAGDQSGTTQVNGKNYGTNINYQGLWDTLDKDGSFRSSSVEQSDIAWYGVEVVRNGDSYTVYYKEGTDTGVRLPIDSETGRIAGTVYKTETYTP